MPLRTRPRARPICSPVTGWSSPSVRNSNAAAQARAGIVLVGQRGAEHRVQIGTLVADGQMQGAAAVTVDDRCEATMNASSLVSASGSVSKSMPPKPGTAAPRYAVRRGTRPSGTHPLVHRPRQPLPDQRLGQRCGRLRGRRSAAWASSVTTETAAIARGNARSRRTRSPSRSAASGSRQIHPQAPARSARPTDTDQRPGQHVDQLAPTDPRPRTGAPGPTAMANLHRQLNGPARGRGRSARLKQWPAIWPARRPDGQHPSVDLS